MPQGHYPRPDYVTRFWKKVDIKGEDDCWNWKNGKIRDGYGMFWLETGNVRAHKLAYILTYGDIDDSLVIMHKCDNPSCCNPRHLQPGTQMQNVHDCMKKGRRRVVFGESRSNSKLTNEDVMEIRRRYDNGESGREIAKSIGMSRWHVTQIARREAWTHIP